MEEKFFPELMKKKAPTTTNNSQQNTKEKEVEKNQWAHRNEITEFNVQTILFCNILYSRT